MEGPFSPIWRVYNFRYTARGNTLLISDVGLETQLFILRGLHYHCREVLHVYVCTTGYVELPFPFFACVLRAVVSSTCAKSYVGCVVVLFTTWEFFHSMADVFIPSSGEQGFGLKHTLFYFFSRVKFRQDVPANSPLGRPFFSSPPTSINHRHGGVILLYYPPQATFKWVYLHCN